MPVDPHLFVVFLGVMAVMAITPGPANLFAVAIGLERGRAAALVAVVGMNAATLVWFGAAALGLGALVAAFPGIFRWIALAGAAYVAWLGVSALHKALRSRPPSADTTPRSSHRPAWLDGFLVQIANPKAVLFFTAVLPPFLDPDRPSGPQLAVFAAVVVAMDALSMSAYGLGGAALARRMSDPRFRRAFGVFTGILLLAASVLIASRL